MTARSRAWVGGLLAAFAVGFASSPASAQSRLLSDVDTTLVTVGDRVTLTVVVDHTAGSQVRWPDSVSLAPFEVLDAAASPPEPVDGGLRSALVLSLAAFELGELEIPSLDVGVVAADGSEEVLSTDRFGVEVVSVGRDESGDIRGIVGPLAVPVSVLRVGGWLLLLLALAGVAWWWWRRRGRGGDAEDIFTGPPARPAYEIALEDLDALEASPLLERGQVKEFHIAVSDILRTYVEGHFGVHALEMTTWEVLSGLDAVDLDRDARDRLRKFLEQCDLVKFAKVRPEADQSRAVLRLGRAIVEETMGWRPSEPEVEVAPTAGHDGDSVGADPDEAVGPETTETSPEHVEVAD